MNLPSIKVLLEKQVYSTGVYIGLKVDKQTEDKIKEYQNKYLKDTYNNEDLHCTLIYSKKPYKDIIEPKQYKCKASFKSFDYFGKDNNCLVFKLNSDDLIKRNKELIEQYNFISDYDSYQPHITLAYNCDIDIEKLPEIDFDIILENEYVEPLDEEWLEKD